MNGKGALLLVAFCCTGCVVERAGPTEHSTSTIDRDNAELVRVNLNMGAGSLGVDGGGTDKLAIGNFTYNVESWKPEVSYTRSAGRGTLAINQPDEVHSHALGHKKYEWDIRLNREVPLEIAAHFGAGEARLTLGELTLRDVEVEMGAGKLDLDLRGTPKSSYDVRVRGGVGEATFRLPSNVGMEADVTGGIGEIEAPHLHREGTHYRNDAFATSKVTIRLDIKGGVGSIRLISY